MFDPFDLFGHTSTPNPYMEPEVTRLERVVWLKIARLQLVRSLKSDAVINDKDFRAILATVDRTLQTSIASDTEELGALISKLEIEPTGSLYEKAKAVVHLWQAVADEEKERLMPKDFTEKIDELRQALGLKPKGKKT